VRRLAPIAVGLLAFGLVGGGCQKGTYLKLVFKGDGLPPIHHMQVELKLADGRAAIGALPRNPPTGNVVKMPASAVFILDDYSGVLNIDAAAFDALNVRLATDHATTTIAHATSWEVELNLRPGIISALDGPVVDAPPTREATPVIDATWIDLGFSISNGNAAANGDANDEAQPPSH